MTSPKTSTFLTSCLRDAKTNDAWSLTVNTMAKASDSHETGTLKHGQAKLLRVAGIARAIHMGVLSTHDTDDDKPTFTLDVANALGWARGLYDALDHGKRNGTLLVTPDANIKEQLPLLANALNPWRYKKTVLPHKLTRGAAKDEFCNGKDPTPEIISALDVTTNARKLTVEAIKLAVLYVYHDRDGELLDQFNEHEGLLVRDQMLMGWKRMGVNDYKQWTPSRADDQFPDPKARIAPVAGKQGPVEGKLDMRAYNKADEKQKFEPTLNSMVAAGIWPTPVDTSKKKSKDPAISAAKTLDKQIAKLHKATHVTAEQMKAIRNTLSNLNEIDQKWTKAAADAQRNKDAQEKNAANAKPSGYQSGPARRVPNMRKKPIPAPVSAPIEPEALSA